MTDKLLILEVEEEDRKLGIRQPTFDIECGILTSPVIAPDKVRLQSSYRWDKNKDLKANIHSFKTRFAIQLQDEFERPVFRLILDKLVSIFNKNKDVLQNAVIKIPTVTEDPSQTNFKFEFIIPDGLKAEDVDITLSLEVVKIRIKDQVISCKIQNKVQDVIIDFGLKFSALVEDVDLGSRILFKRKSRSSKE